MLKLAKFLYIQAAASRLCVNKAYRHLPCTNNTIPLKQIDFKAPICRIWRIPMVVSKLEFLFFLAERREALKAELDRLKGDPTGQKKAPVAPEPASMSASKGSITLQELRLPLKADFVCSTANKPGKVKMHITTVWSIKVTPHCSSTCSSDISCQ